MTQYGVETADGLTLRIEYLDPAGGFGGWFLLTLPSYLTHPVTSTTGDDSVSNWVSLLSNTSGQYHPVFQAAVSERLIQLFGNDSCVNWKATFLQSITPAVFDDDY